jgi:lysozyme family protein
MNARHSKNKLYTKLTKMAFHARKNTQTAYNKGWVDGVLEARDALSAYLRLEYEQTRDLPPEPMPDYTVQDSAEVKRIQEGSVVTKFVLDSGSDTPLVY